MTLIIPTIIAALSLIFIVLILLKLSKSNNNDEINILKTEFALAKQELDYKNSQLQEALANLEHYRDQIDKLKSKEQTLTEEKIRYTNENSRLITENQNLKHAYTSLEQLLTELKEQLTKEFHNIKTQALLELQNKASETLGTIGRTNVVEPLAAKLRELDTRIIELRKETQDINLKSNSLSEQAGNLAQALIRDSQKKGEFGEMILANILEFAGLKERVNFIEQAHITTQNTNGKNLRADCLINLPDGRGLIIDSKNIIGEYYTAINNNEDRNKAIRSSITTTIKLFADKEYISEMERITGHNLFDYMIMFIPNEGLFNLIVEMDAKQDERGLLWLAYSQKVIIAGPSTILPILAIIDRMWQSHQIEEKAAEIVKTAVQMIDQLRITLERMTTLGNSIDKVAENYNQVVTSFANGTNGSFVGKFIQLTNYKREIDISQPILNQPAIKRLPDTELNKETL